MSTKFLKLTDGTIAYDDTEGSGPLVILIPGMGDVRGEYRFVVPALREAGYRVVTMDLRGHGESSVGWPEYTVAAVGQDILALIGQLDAGPATVIGTSFSPGAAVWAAAEKPAAIQALVLVGAFVRTPKTSAIQKILLSVMMNGPWKVRAWDMYLKTLYPSQQPADFDVYRQRLRANLNEPGRFEAVRQMGATSRDDAEVRLERVKAPSLVVMGTKDPDWPSPEAEAQFMGEKLSAEVVMVEGAGHYPHAEMPEQVIPIMKKFLAEVTETGGA